MTTPQSVLTDSANTTHAFHPERQVRAMTPSTKGLIDAFSSWAEQIEARIDALAANQGPTTPPPPPPPNEEPHVPPPQPSGPYRVVKHGSVPGADELTNPAKYPFKTGDTVWKAVNPRGQVSWYVAEANDPKPSVEGFSPAFTL